MKIINRKTRIIFIETATYVNNTVTIKINNIPFIPNEVIVRNVNVLNTDATNEFFILSSNLVNEKFILSCAVPASSAVNVLSDQHFILDKEINGDYNFTLYDSNGSITTLNNMIIGITLEFIEYSKDK